MRAFAKSWNVGHFGTGDLEITLSKSDDLEKAKPLIQRSYDDFLMKGGRSSRFGGQEPSTPSSVRDTTLEARVGSKEAI